MARWAATPFESFIFVKSKWIQAVGVSNLVFPLVLVTGSLAFNLAAASASPESAGLLAVFPPWWTAEEQQAAMIQANTAGGSTGLSFVIAVRSRDDDLGTRLKSAGALLLFGAPASKFCGS